MAAIARTKALTAIAQMGRIDSRRPNGWGYEKVWLPPVIVYPRPAAERSADASSFKLGLHTEFDKYPADTAYFARLKVMHGAKPYRAIVKNERVDGVAASIGLRYSQFIEDHTSNDPYLAIKHPGFTAPSGGTRLYEYTVEIHTPAGEAVASVDIATTVYARDHASFTTHFCVFSTDGGANGTGTFANPVTVFSGGLSNGNPTVVGNDWNGNGTSVSKTRMLLIVGNGTFAMATAMANPPHDSDTRAWFVGQQGPRQIVVVPDNTPTYNITAGVSEPLRGGLQRDITIHGLRIRSTDGDPVGFCFYSFDWNRVNVYDMTVEDINIQGVGGNPAPFISAIDAGSYGSLSYITPINIYTNVDDANQGSVCNFFCELKQFILIEHIGVPSSQGSGSQVLHVGVRIKHGSKDCEFHAIESLGYSPAVPKAKGISTTTDSGDHIRMVVRGCKGLNSALAYHMMVNGVLDRHSVMYHHNVFKGPLSHGTAVGGGVQNAGGFHAARNIIENANHATNFGWGAMDADYIPATGKSALIENSLSGAIGSLVDANGDPLNPAHVGVYGPSAIGL